MKAPNQRRMKRKGDMGGVMVAAVVALALSIRCVVATDYTVGEGTCVAAVWSYQSGCDYNTWALTHEFAVGDRLVFNFVVGTDNVAEVTKLDYDMCTVSIPTNPIYVYGRSPATIPLSKTGTFYFLSTALGFSLCSLQKLAVTVNATTSSRPPSAFSPPSVPVDNHTPTPTTTTTTTSTTTTPAASSSSSSSHSTMVKAVVGSVVGFVLFVAKILIIVYCMRKRRLRQEQIRIDLAVPAPPINHAADHVLNAH